MRKYEVVAIIDMVLNNHYFRSTHILAEEAKTSSRKIRHGDPVIIDMGTVWMGYIGCMEHTFIV